MLPCQKTGPQWTVRHDGDVVCGAVITQLVAHLTDGEVLVVLNHAEARSEGAELIERDIAGSESLHGQFFERGIGLQRCLMPLMQIKQVDLLHAEAFQALGDVKAVIGRQDLRGDGHALRLSRSQPLSEDRFRSSTAVGCSGIEVSDSACEGVIEKREGGCLVDLPTEGDAAETDAG